MIEPFWLFGKGLLFGVSIAAPVGPMALLVIRATLERGIGGGLVAGLGIAVADATYGAIAAFGLQTLTASLLEYKASLALIGGTFLVWLGIQTIFRPAAVTTSTTALRLADAGGIFGRMYLLTMANPPTILTFLALFASLGLAGAGKDWVLGVTVVAGVLLGSLAWWVVLSAVMAKLGGRIDRAMLAWINRLSGLILTAFGLWALNGLLDR